MTAEQLQLNHDEYVRLVKTLPYSEEVVQRFLDWLETRTDFFTAPASTRYHLACEGGLCAHTLNVVHTMEKLLPLTPVDLKGNWLLVALLHDLSKVNFYEETYQNKKVYSERGAKQDSLGRFDWESFRGYKVRDAADRFIYASHAQTAEYLARCFFTLNVEESCAILHHMGPYDDAVSTGDRLSEVYSKHALAALLHMADFFSTHMLENE